MLGELNPDGRLDKDTYRQGMPFPEVLERYRKVAGMTSQFGKLE